MALRDEAKRFALVNHLQMRSSTLGRALTWAVAVALCVGDLAAPLPLPPLPPPLLRGWAVPLYPVDPVVVRPRLLPEHIRSDDGRADAVAVVADNEGAEGGGEDQTGALLDAVFLGAAHEGDLAVTGAKQTSS